MGVPAEVKCPYRTLLWYLWDSLSGSSTSVAVVLTLPKTDMDPGRMAPSKTVLLYKAVLVVLRVYHVSFQ